MLAEVRTRRTPNNVILQRCAWRAACSRFGDVLASDGGMLMDVSSAGSNVRTDLPAVDDRLVAPESGYEIEDGKLVKVAPSDHVHGSSQCALGALLRAHRADDRNVATDMLTRLTERDDMAPDASVYPSAPDPVTGGRQIEELAFEVLSSERLGHAGTKAAKLRARGVRRVFAVDVLKQRAFEWSRELEAWTMLATSAFLEDDALAVPLPVEALVDASVADLATVRAFRAKRHPEFLAEHEAGFERGRAEGREEGRQEGRNEGRLEVQLESLRRALSLRFGVDDPAIIDARLAGASPEAVEYWFARVFTASTFAGVFDDD